MRNREWEVPTNVTDKLVFFSCFNVQNAVRIIWYYIYFLQSRISVCVWVCLFISLCVCVCVIKSITCQYHIQSVLLSLLWLRLIQNTSAPTCLNKAMSKLISQAINNFDPNTVIYSRVFLKFKKKDFAKVSIMTLSQRHNLWAFFWDWIFDHWLSA